ncbi:MAG: META domain-containing protein [Candidatus Nanopelagicales bacterium]|nr:META domain-containing protein [Candidatus Nanopelagicales bacterium]
MTTLRRTLPVRLGAVAAAAATIVTAGAGTALAATSSPQQITTLAGTTWTLGSFAGTGGKQTTAVASANATLRFVRGGTVTGSTGCNNFTGTYRQSGSSVTITPGPMTLKACPGALATQEAAVLAAFPKIVSFSSDQTTTKPAVAVLVLKDAQRATQLSYVATATGLRGTSWQATGVNNGKQALVSDASVAAITANFGTDGRLTGTGGCNNYNASYRTVGQRIIRIGAVASTMMACDPAVMTTEANYFTALGRSVRFTREGSVLTLRDAKGAMQATFTIK